MADDIGLKSSNLARKLKLYATVAGPTATITIPFNREEAQAFVDCLEWLDGIPTQMEEQRQMYDEKIATMKKGVRAHAWMLVAEALLVAALIGWQAYIYW